MLQIVAFSVKASQQIALKKCELLIESIDKWGLRYGWAVKNTTDLAEDPEFNSQHSHSSSWLLTLVPRDPLVASEGTRHISVQTYMQEDIETHKTMWIFKETKGKEEDL